MDYKDYTVKDFLHDELFRKWIIRPDNDTAIFWETWLCEHPDQRVTLEQARDVLLLIGPEEYIPAAEDKAEVWSRIAYSSAGVMLLHWLVYLQLLLPAGIYCEKRNRLSPVILLLMEKPGRLHCLIAP
jgi:hypothetical protein